MEASGKFVVNNDLKMVPDSKDLRIYIDRHQSNTFTSDRCQIYVDP